MNTFQDFETFPMYHLAMKRFAYIKLLELPSILFLEKKVESWKFFLHSTDYFEDRVKEFLLKKVLLFSFRRIMEYSMSS